MLRNKNKGELLKQLEDLKNELATVSIALDCVLQTQRADGVWNSCNSLSLACSLALCTCLLAASRGQGDWQQRLQARKDRRCAQGHCSRLDCLQPAAEERCKSSTCCSTEVACSCLLAVLTRCAIPRALPLSPFLGQLREAYGTKKYVPTDLRPKRTRAIRRRLSKREVRESPLSSCVLC